MQEVRYRNLANEKEHFAFGMENQARGYENTKTYLDNNRPGQEGTKRFKAEFGSKVFPQS